jgi:hypothetical protein
VLPQVYVSLVFLYSVSYVPQIMCLIERNVPWASLIRFSNVLDPDHKLHPLLEDEYLSPPDKAAQTLSLPEDFEMKGQLWCQQYYKEDFFKQYPLDGHDGGLEEYSFIKIREARYLYLVHKISKASITPSIDSNMLLMLFFAI